jgi:hypothetical protein
MAVGTQIDGGTAVQKEEREMTIAVDMEPSELEVFLFSACK